jgi:hypothetical protein
MKVHAKNEAGSYFCRRGNSLECLYNFVKLMFERGAVLSIVALGRSSGTASSPGLLEI